MAPAPSPIAPRWRSRCWRYGRAAKSRSTATRCIDGSARQLVDGLDDECRRRAGLVGLFIELGSDHPFCVQYEDDGTGHAVSDAAWLVLRVAQAETVNYHRSRIAQQ